MSVALGILQTAQPVWAMFDLCGRVATEAQYVRGLEISQLTAWSYQLFGVSTEAARVVPFAFTMASWLLYVLYVTLRLRVGRGLLLTATLLFFAQSMVLEQALNDRVYAPILFFLLLMMIALWEARRLLQERRVVATMFWIVVAGLSLGIPTPRWHFIMVPIAAVAITLLWLSHRPALLWPFQRLQQAVQDLPAVWKVLLIGIVLYGTICTGAIASWLLDVVAGRLLGFQRVHAIYWDNLFGLVRFLLVLNVLIIGWVRVQRSPMDFFSWLFCTGIVSGFLVGLFMTHTFIFYSRFFYLSVALASLGAAGWLVRTSPSVRLGLLFCYLLVNGTMSGVTLGLDRSNVKRAIAWLTDHTNAQDVILVFNADLSMHGGTDLCDRAYPILSEQFQLPGRALASLPSQRVASPISYVKARDPNRMRNLYITADDLKALFDQHPGSAIYFLYTDPHFFRDRLYQLTTGKPRSIRHDLYGLLKDWDVGEPVDVPGLRGCGVKRLNWEKLFSTLEANGIGSSG